MDPITHGLSGAVATLILPPQVRTRWLPVWGAVVAMSPDVDVFFTQTAVEYIKWHRGPTHSLVGALVLAFVSAMALLMLLSWSSERRKPDAASGGARYGWTATATCTAAYFLLLHHIWLDCVTSYGTQVFWPFSDLRVRWSGLFIIDLLLLIPLLAGVVFWRGNQRVMAWLLLWTLVYPMAACLARPLLEERLDIAMLAPDKRIEERIVLTPDALAPFCWKLLKDTPPAYQVAPYVVFEGAPKMFEATFAKPDATRWAALQAASNVFRVYAAFAQYPVLEDNVTLPTGERELTYTDLRFGSEFAWVRRIQQSTPDDPDKTFRIMARLSPAGQLEAVRLRITRGAGGDSGWERPASTADAAPFF